MLSFIRGALALVSLHSMPTTCALAAPLATVSIVEVTRVTCSGAWMEKMVPTLPGFGDCQFLVCCFIEEELDQNDSLELSIPDLGGDGHQTHQDGGPAFPTVP